MYIGPCAYGAPSAWSGRVLLSTTEPTHFLSQSVVSRKGWRRRSEAGPAERQKELRFSLDIGTGNLYIDGRV